MFAGAAVFAAAWMGTRDSDVSWSSVALACALLVAIVAYLLERRRWTSRDNGVSFS
jgi:hypothetical protein